MDLYSVTFTTNQKINLIKELRSAFGIGLKEAKDAVEIGMNTDSDGAKLCQRVVGLVGDGDASVLFGSNSSFATFIAPRKASLAPAANEQPSRFDGPGGAIDNLITEKIAHYVQVALRSALVPVEAELAKRQHEIEALTARLKPLERSILSTVELDDLDLNDD